MKGDIQRIFRQFGDAYIAENAQDLTEQHRKVIRAIQRCGTPEAGWIAWRCCDCGQRHYVERSRGSRGEAETACPTGGSGRSAA